MKRASTAAFAQWTAPPSTATHDEEELVMPNPMGDRDKLLGFMPGMLTNVFRCMDIAGEEINAAKKKWPKRAADIDKSFRLLMPGPLSGSREEIYRHHCREILERVAKGEDVTMATVAEMLLAVSEFTTKTPVTSTLAALYEKLFVEVFGAKARIEGSSTKEPYPGAAEELRQQMRKRGRVPNRGTEAEVFSAADVAHEAVATVQGSAPRKVRPTKSLRARKVRIVWEG